MKLSIFVAAVRACGAEADPEQVPPPPPHPLPFPPLLSTHPSRTLLEPFGTWRDACDGLPGAESLAEQVEGMLANLIHQVTSPLRWHQSLRQQSRMPAFPATSCPAIAVRVYGFGAYLPLRCSAHTC